MRIAVIGSGISGLVSASLLSPRHDVVIFEAEPRPGGHTHTVDVPDGNRVVPVDTGFIVFNDWTYPNFMAMLRELGVAWQPSNMSFSLRCERSGLEYNGTSLNALFAQRRNLIRPSFLRMLAEIVRRHGVSPQGLLSRIKKHPELLDSLSEHKQVAALAETLQLTVEPLTLDFLKEGADLSPQQRLLTNDALLLAVVKKLGLSYLATNDDDFDSIPGLTVCKPTRT